jgi:hypothetical protein
MHLWKPSPIPALSLTRVKCSYFVPRMQSLSKPRRFPPPWTVKQLAECFIVNDAEGTPLAYIYFDANTMKIANSHHHLTWDEARRISAGIARLPELMRAAK